MAIGAMKALIKMDIFRPVGGFDGIILMGYVGKQMNKMCIRDSISIMPFYVMFINSTRSTTEIQQHAISFLPSRYMLNNLKILLGKSFNPAVGFRNSLIISIGSTALAVYFSSLTAYALVAYDWKLRQPFFSFIMCVTVSYTHLNTRYG